MSRLDKSFIDCIDNARYDLRQLMQRWDDRLILEGLVFSEAYKEGRLTVTCDLQSREGARYRCHFASNLHNNPVKLKTWTEPFSRQALKNNVPDFGDVEYWRKKDMLVLNVQVVQSVEGVIPSFVWFYRMDDAVNNLARNSLFYSAIDLAYKFAPTFENWKFSPPTDVALRSADDITVSNIKCGAQVVDCVSNYELNALRRLSSELKIECKYTGLIVWLECESVEVRLDKFFNDSIQVVDVMIGPFDL